MEKGNFKLLSIPPNLACALIPYKPCSCKFNQVMLSNNFTHAKLQPRGMEASALKKEKGEYELN
jgi:hypothetical protein